MATDTNSGDEFAVEECPASLRGVYHEFAEMEKWNPGCDARQLDAFIEREAMLVVRRGDEAVATIVCPKYGPDFAWIGVFVCKPAYRKQGHGARVWAAAERYLRGVANVGLDAVPEQVPRYERAGFRVHNESARWSIRLGALRTATSQPSSSSSSSSYAVASLLPGDAALLDQCVAFDRAHVAPPLQRRQLLVAWLTAAEHRSFVVRSDGAVLGFATVRPSSLGYRVGPLYALDPSVAALLLASVADRLADDDDDAAAVFVDVSSLATAASDFFAGLGFARQFALARMYRGASPISPRCSAEFALFNWELTF